MDRGHHGLHASHRLLRKGSIVASGRAYAALLEEGNVVSWGDPQWGGDSSKARPRSSRSKRERERVDGFWVESGG